MIKVLIIKSMKVEERQIEENAFSDLKVRFWIKPTFKDIVILPKARKDGLDWIIAAYNHQLSEKEAVNESNEHLVQALDAIYQAGFWARLRMLFFGFSR